MRAFEGRGHVDNASDQLELHILRVLLVAAVKLRLRQPLAIPQRSQCCLSCPRWRFHRPALVSVNSRSLYPRQDHTSQGNPLGHSISPPSHTPSLLAATPPP